METGSGQNPLILQDKLQGPTGQLQSHNDQCTECQNERQRHTRLDDHQPAGQEPLTDHIVLPAEDVVAPIEGSGELIVRVSEILEAILPEAHVFEITE